VPIPDNDRIVRAQDPTRDSAEPLGDDALEFVVGGLDRPLELPRELVRAQPETPRLVAGA
jgi:hypothetical protein